MKFAKRFQRSELLLNLAKTVLSKTGVAIFGALTAILISSSAGKDALGSYAAVRLVPVFFVLFVDLGYSGSYSYKINKQKEITAVIFQNGVGWISCIFFVHVIALAGLLVAVRSGLMIEYPPVASVLLILVSFFYAALLHAMNFFRATMQLGIANRIFSALEFFILLFVFFVIKVLSLKFTDVIFSEILLLAHFITFILILFYLVRLGHTIKMRFDVNVISSSIQYGLRTQLGSAAQIIYYRIDQMIVGFYLGVGDLGLYFIASKSAEIFRILVVAIVFVYEPLLARLKSEDAIILVKKTYWKLIFYNGILVILGILSVPYLIPFFFGQWAASAVLPTLIIILGLTLSGSSGLIGAFNYSIGKPGLNNLVILSSLVIMIVLNFSLIPFMGVIGAAIAAAITQTFSAIGYRVGFNRYVKIG